MGRWRGGIVVLLAVLLVAPATGAGADVVEPSPAAAEYLSLVAPTNRAAAALPARVEQVDDAGDTYRILNDLIARRGLREAVKEDLTEAGFFPAAVRPEVEALVAATTAEVARYDDAIERIDTGELDEDAMAAVGDAEDARGEAAADLREALGLPTSFGDGPVPGDLGSYEAPTPLWSGGRQLIVLVLVYGLCGVLIVRMVRRSVSRSRSRAIS